MDEAAGITPRPTGRCFPTLVAAAVIATVALGFSRGYYLRPVFRTAPLLPLRLRGHDAAARNAFASGLVK